MFKSYPEIVRVGVEVVIEPLFFEIVILASALVLVDESAHVAKLCFDGEHAKEPAARPVGDLLRGEEPVDETL